MLVLGLGVIVAGFALKYGLEVSTSTRLLHVSHNERPVKRMSGSSWRLGFYAAALGSVYFTH